MARYLVTGGAGFIGSHICAALMERGDEVVALDNLSTGSREKLPSGARLIVGDVADPALTRKAADGVDGVFHLAAVASVPECNERWYASHRANASGTVSALQSARDVGGVPVVFASTSAVYGDARDMPIPETAPTAPLSFYGADKLAGEMHAAPAAALHGVPSASLRLFNIYGPGQNADSPYSGVIALFARRMRRGEGVTINGDGAQTRDFVFVADAARAFIAAMDRLGADRAAGGAAQPLTANVCTGRATTVLQLATTIRDILDRDLPIDHGPDRPGDIRQSVGDPRRLEQLFGVRAETAVADGLAKLLR